MYKAKIICDSISETGKRLTTFEITLPRIVLAEAKTHRVIRGMGGNVEEEMWLSGLGLNDDENLSRNSASSRAIPVEKMIKMVMENPFIPERFPLKGKGMQPVEWIEQDNPEYNRHKNYWIYNRDFTVKSVEVALNDFGWHKQIANRLLEPFMWHTVIATATEWDNFFKLRTNEQAQYELRRIADLMYEAYHNSGQSVYNGNQCDRVHAHQQKLKVGEWHCPLVFEEDLEPICELATGYDFPDNAVIQLKKKISVARCARVSYLTHDGKRDIKKDLELFERLRTSGHWSPFEHVATPHPMETWHGNFRGWLQYRKIFNGENKE